jgi:hypothetical protein
VRTFNTAGPCDPALHYIVPPESRLPEARGLVDGGAYFVVHAPRQTGKTTTLRALARTLTAEGRYAALHFTCEMGEPLGEDVAAAERVVWYSLERAASLALPAELRPAPRIDADAGALLSVNLTAWARACPRPLVLFFDEIDALRGESLRAALRQLRAGFPDRPGAFPHAVVLCGLRDVRDYKAASGGDPQRLGTSSPFNIKLVSLRLGDFSEAEMRALYAQHTVETGQAFTEDALGRACTLSAGQPWLVNALAREVIEELKIDPSVPVTGEHMEEAKERLILARATHLDSLVARLMEPRVRRVIAPIVAGELVGGDGYDDDLAYLRDLGLVTRRDPVAIANPIYREVIVRVLAAAAESNIAIDVPRFIAADGRLDLRRLLDEFVAFWREHGEALVGRMPYHEVAPQLILMAFLQRVVNGGGYVEREYGVGRGRIDLLVRWPYTPPGGQRTWQREAIEVKVRAPGRPDPLARGLEQLDAYLERLGLASGVLVIFDRRGDTAAPSEPAFSATRTPSGRDVTLLRA